MPEWMFIRLRQSGVIDVEDEKGIWKTTPSGIVITEFANTPLQMFFNKMEEDILKREDDEEPDLGYIV